jgi:hypothetical protein
VRFMKVRLCIGVTLGRSIRPRNVITFSFPAE